MKFLIDFVNVLPTLTRSFSNRYGLPARLQLRWFHPDDANRYFLFLRDSNIRALRNIFSGREVHRDGARSTPTRRWPGSS